MIERFKKRILELDPDADVEGKTFEELRAMYRDLRRASPGNRSPDVPYQNGARVRKGVRYFVKDMEGRFVYNGREYLPGDPILPNELDDTSKFEHYVKNGTLVITRAQRPGRRR